MNYALLEIDTTTSANLQPSGGVKVLGTFTTMDKAVDAWQAVAFLHCDYYHIVHRVVPVTS